MAMRGELCERGGSGDAGLKSSAAETRVKILGRAQLAVFCGWEASWGSLLLHSYWLVGAPVQRGVGPGGSITRTLSVKLPTGEKKWLCMGGQQQGSAVSRTTVWQCGPCQFGRKGRKCKI